MAKINEGTLKDWADGQTVTADLYKQEREILRAAINDNDQNFEGHVGIGVDITSSDTTKNKHVSNKNMKDLHDKDTAQQTALDSQGTTIANHDERIVLIEDTLPTKATITYVNQEVAKVQNGLIADGSVTRQKIVDGEVINSKLANGVVTASKVDGTTVYTAEQVDEAIDEDVAEAKSGLQTQIDENGSDIEQLNDDVIGTNVRIDNLAYNKDLYSAKQDILVLTINMEILKGSELTGVSENMVIETLESDADLTYIGLYDQGNRKIYLP